MQMGRVRWSGCGERYFDLVILIKLYSIYLFYLSLSRTLFAVSES